MNELSRDARDYLAAFAEQHQPSAGAQPPVPAFERRSRAAGVWLVAAAVVAVAAAVAVWLAGSTQLVDSQVRPSADQAPYASEPQRQPAATQTRSAAGVPQRPEPQIEALHTPLEPDAEPIPEPGAADPPAAPSPDPATASGETRQGPASRSRDRRLARELRLLDRARLSLRTGEYARATRLLARHRAEFPSGELAPERRALKRRLEKQQRNRPEPSK